MIDITTFRHGEPITRQELSDMFGLSDREVRKSIETLREKGYPICSHSSGKGYYLPTSYEQVKLARAEEMKRLQAAKRKIEMYDKWLQSQDQMMLGV